ncbi:MAG: ATP-binding protein [Myxococcales bacterium]|nr:ATP-binding protein [Myxococcales bacterium]
MPKNYFPTATFTAIQAFSAVGVWLPNAERKPKRAELHTSTLVIPNGHALSAPAQVLDALFGTDPSLYSETLRFRRLFIEKKSELGSEAKKKLVELGQLTDRRLVLTPARLLRAIDALVGSLTGDAATAQLPRVRVAIDVSTEYLFEAMMRDGAVRTEADLTRPDLFTPDRLFYAADVLWSRRRLVDWLVRFGETRTNDDAAKDAQADATAETLRTRLQSRLTALLEHQMSRRAVPGDPEYDPATLAFALRGASLWAGPLPKSPFFGACVDAIVRAQTPDGTWPAGLSFEYTARGDGFFTPSVEIALLLADSVFERRLLVEYTPHEIALLEAALPALRKCGHYLTQTFQEVAGEDGSVKGWSSDRLRWPSLAETWITSHAVRVFHTLWLAERAVARAATLASFRADLTTASAAPKPLDGKDWEAAVVEADAITTPRAKLWKQFILPVREAAAAQEYLRCPSEKGVSFIIYGPPGSGKTFLMKEFAGHLGWPLVSLNPGHFIERGLELIETTSRAIFDALKAVDHAVVFFDECDELFREREPADAPAVQAAGAASNRNILSFVTACMLPKLQELHDERRVIFVVGTNFLANIDAAIRRPGRFDALVLLDRPDDVARAELLKGGWAKGTNSPMPPERVSELVKSTAGWMPKEVSEEGRAAQKGASIREEVDTGDYREWCEKIGPREIKDARLKNEQKDKLELRWKDLARTLK